MLVPRQKCTCVVGKEWLQVNCAPHQDWDMYLHGHAAESYLLCTDVICDIMIDEGKTKYAELAKSSDEALAKAADWHKLPLGTRSY